MAEDEVKENKEENDIANWTLTLLKTILFKKTVFFLSLPLKMSTPSLLTSFPTSSLFPDSFLWVFYANDHCGDTEEGNVKKTPLGLL